MRFSAEQRYDHDRHTVLAAYTDAELVNSLSGYTKITPRGVVGSNRSGDQAVTQIRYAFIAPLSDKVTKFIDPSKLTWVEVATFGLGTGEQFSKLDADNYASMLSASWNGRFNEADGGTLRTVEGDFRLKLPLPVRMFSGKIEQLIVDGILQYLREEQTAMAQALATD